MPAVDVVHFSSDDGAGHTTVVMLLDFTPPLRITGSVGVARECEEDVVDADRKILDVIENLALRFEQHWGAGSSTV
jgi:hypothetical protein